MAAGALRGSPVHEVLEILAVDLHAKVSLMRWQRSRLASAAACSHLAEPGCAAQSVTGLGEALTGAQGRTCVRMLEMASTSSYCELLLWSSLLLLGRSLPADLRAETSVCWYCTTPTTPACTASMISLGLRQAELLCC